MILQKKQEELRLELKRIQDSIDYIDWKQNYYDDVVAGKRAFFSNLVGEE